MLTGDQLVQKIKEKFPGTVFQRVDKTRVYLTVNSDLLTGLAGYLFNELGAHFVTTVGTDKRTVSGKFDVSYIFSFHQDSLVVAVRVEVDGNQPVIDSITPVIPGANWAEREVRDLLGVAPRNHPDPRRLIVSDDWPEDVFPLRRDVPHNYRPPRVEKIQPDMKGREGNGTVVSVGPFFPTLEEPAYFRLFLEGEKVVGCDYRGFYSHRGIEKLADTVLDYNQVPFMAERICGICGFLHSSSYCQAVEEAGRIEVPSRAKFIRTIMLELERIHSHLLWLGLAGHIIGFDTVLMQSWRIREPVMWLAEYISGNRKTYGMNLVGGVRRDIPSEMHAKIRETLDSIESQSRAVVNAIVKDKPLLMRLQGVGVLSREDARKICVVGPTARASGINMDCRVDHPYAAYGDLEVKVPVYQDGDVLARTLVRLDELFVSIDLIRQALGKMPAGEIMAEIKEIPAWQEGISLVEAPRGEACHYVLTGMENRPYRWRVRASTYPQLQAVPNMLEKSTVADFPIIVGSIDPCFSCTERVETVDAVSKKIRIYRQEELLSGAREKFQGGDDRC